MASPTDTEHQAPTPGPGAAVDEPRQSASTGEGAERVSMESAPVRAAAAETKPGDGSAQPASSPIIVGVGASAGGLEAFRQFIEALPAKIDFAIVYVQHRKADKESQLQQLLARGTQLRVVEVLSPTIVEANTLYIAPPDSKLAVEAGALLPRAFESPETRQHTIDYFLRSLAADRMDNAFGVILSGTGSDGTLGLKAIRDEGGITFAQDGKSAKFDGMPLAAVRAGVADFVLPPKDIATEIVRLCGLQPRPATAHTVARIGGDPEGEWLRRILAIVCNVSGVDFSYYKPTTLKRRILRRVLLKKLDSVADYLRHLETNVVEARALYHDLVINVTHFFREPDVFEALKADVLPTIAQAKGGELAIRIWVPGCSTGEEVYSLAITVLEFLGERSSSVTLQLFGTDISDMAIERARSAIYPSSIENDVSPERLQRFFVKRDAGYQISKPVRDLCIFARQNVFKDPPFSSLDIISCRNVLIYFGPELQKRVLPMFHYALNASGYLILGGSESIGLYTDYFALAHPRFKIYAKKGVAVQQAMQFSRMDFGGDRSGISKSVREEAGRVVDPLRDADRLILEKYGPPSVLINSDMNVLQFRGRTGAFLEPAPGAASFNLLRMAREGLTVILHTAIQEALGTESAVKREGVRFRGSEGFQRVDLSILPLAATNNAARERFLLVLFESLRYEGERRPPEPLPAPAAGDPVQDVDREAHELRQELAATKEYLQSVVESQEAFNEELRAANEEILSANEELQSTNEELETAKEELQSANEELTTLNEELHTRNGDLTKINDDLGNLLNGINLAIVMLDGELRVRRFTPLAEKLMNLIPADIGRPFSDINPRVLVPDLIGMIREVIETLATSELEVKDSEDRWYSLRIRPYRTADNRIEGVVIALADIASVKQKAEHAQQVLEYSEALAEAVTDPVVMLTREWRIYHANRAFCGRFKVALAEIQHRRLNELGDVQLNSQSLRKLLEEDLPRHVEIDGYVVTPSGGAAPSGRVVVNARRLSLKSEEEPLSLLVITEWKGPFEH